MPPWRQMMRASRAVMSVQDSPRALHSVFLFHPFTTSRFLSTTFQCLFAHACRCLPYIREPCMLPWWFGAARDTPLHSHAPIHEPCLHLRHVGRVSPFHVQNFVGIIPLALILGDVTEDLALRCGDVVGGLVNATFGNVVELIISCVALTKNTPELNNVAGLSNLGSVLSNLLLVLGACLSFPSCVLHCFLPNLVC